MGTAMTLVDTSLFHLDTNQANERRDSPPSATMASALERLCSVVTQVARIDELLQAARRQPSAEADAEAQQWREVSIQMLLSSRESMERRQREILERIQKAVTDGDSRNAKVSAPLAGKTCASAAALAARKVQDMAPKRPPGIWLPSRVEISPRTEPEAEPEAQVVHHVISQLQHPERTGSPRRSPAGVGSLRADLDRVRRCEPGTVVIIRNIKNLGLKSPEILTEHFSKYGPVEEVLAAHSFEKPSKKRKQGRIRSAGCAFLVMGSAGSAAAIIAEGPEHHIGSVSVKTQTFEPLESLTNLCGESE